VHLVKLLEGNMLIRARRRAVNYNQIYSSHNLSKLSLI
jgi:hypothetical protein